jgi:hypothetical protein
MKGDFTRNTFKPTNHYSSVRSQQGRVQVDADWNEAIDILAHGDRTTRRDVIGPCGGPQGQDSAGNDLAGFLIEVVDGELQITQGRYYVDGLLVENEAEVGLTEQPDLPYPPENTLQDVLVPPGEALSPGTYLAYLDVWEHHLTALEAPDMREVALVGPDTATRTKVVWQVRLMLAAGLEEGAEEAPLNCASALPLWDTVTAPSSGRLSARAEPGEAETDPCVVPARAGYRGLENQLYRVEVHRLISADTITIKWSRENGSVVFGWTGQDNLNPNKLTLGSTGRDDVLGLATDDWVELTDDKHELRGEPGLLVRAVNVEGNVLTIDPGSETVHREAFPVHPKVRRWDMPRDVGEISVDLTLVDNWIALENGVEVKLEPGTYRTGDYWLIPARTATRDIEWPQDDAKNPLSQPPHGIQHHYCRLALLSFDGDLWERLSDCRTLFPPLTEMLRFFHVSGDGQEALPGQPVSRPLQVGVVNGQRPVAGALVQFQVVGGDGRLRAAGESPGPDGVTGCCWRLDATTLSQQVEATLREIDGKPLVDETGTPLLTPIRFNANLSVASQVAYDPQNCPDLSAAQTVQQAIDLLCQRPRGGCCVTVGEGGEYERLDEALKALREQEQRDICICLLPGHHPFSGLELAFPVEESEFHLKITGCGLGSRVFLEQPLRCTGVKAFTLHDVAFELGFVAQGEQGAMALDRCSEVTLTACHLSGFTAGDDNEAQGTLLSITNADRIRLRDNVIEAALINSLEPTRQLFERAEVDFLIELFRLPEQGAFEFEKFRLAALESARTLAGLNPDERQRIRDALQSASGDNQLRTVLSIGELFGIAKFNAALSAEVPQLEDLFDGLLDLRRAAIKSRPGVAVVLGSEVQVDIPQDLAIASLDEDDYATLESNELIGILGLYGMPAPADLVTKISDPDFLGTLSGRLREQEITLTGLLGTLQMRGNQLVQIAVARDILEQLQQLVNNGGGLFRLFGRCLLSDNVIEGATSMLVTQHLAMTANEFTLMALPLSFSLAADTAAIPRTVAVVIADSSIYVGNHGKGRQQNVVLRDTSRANSQAANLEIIIS